MDTQLRDRSFDTFQAESSSISVKNEALGMEAAIKQQIWAQWRDIDQTFGSLNMCTINTKTGVKTCSKTSISTDTIELQLHQYLIL